MSDAGTQDQQDQLRAAIREAAHAVIGRAVGMFCGDAAITQDDNWDTVLEDPWIIWQIWEDRGKIRDLSSAVHGRIITCLARVEAEAEFFGNSQAYDKGAVEVDALLEFAKAKEHQLRAQTRRLVRQHKKAILVVAEALQNRNSLSRIEVNSLCASADTQYDLAAY